MRSKFQAMSVAERAAKLEDLNDLCTTLAITGIRRQHGDLNPADLRWHLAARRYGTALADEVYGPRHAAP